MTERSYYWDGLATGDASLAPASVAIYNTLIWKLLFSNKDNEGHIAGHKNELLVNGEGSFVTVDTGAAIVNGTFYTNDEIVIFTITAPSDDPRIDRIVVQKSVIDKVVRVEVIAGVEASSPSAPALTQTEGTIWEIPLAQILITTSGVITITDERENSKTRLFEDSSLREIETITSDGGEVSLDFKNIPQIYKDLMVMGTIHSTNPILATVNASIFFNGDESDANYNNQRIRASLVTPSAFASNSLATSVYAAAFQPVYNLAAGYLTTEILDYTNTAKYKSGSVLEGFRPALVSAFIDRHGFVWKNTDAINRVQFILPDGLFIAGSTLTLYGRL